MHDLCILTKNYFLTAEINLTTRGPFYTCLVESLFVVKITLFVHLGPKKHCESNLKLTWLVCFDIIKQISGNLSKEFILSCRMRLLILLPFLDLMVNSIIPRRHARTIPTSLKTSPFGKLEKW